MPEDSVIDLIFDDPPEAGIEAEERISELTLVRNLNGE